MTSGPGANNFHLLFIDIYNRIMHNSGLAGLHPIRLDMPTYVIM